MSYLLSKFHNITCFFDGSTFSDRFFHNFLSSFHYHFIISNFSGFCNRNILRIFFRILINLILSIRNLPDSLFLISVWHIDILLDGYNHHFFASANSSKSSFVFEEWLHLCHCLLFCSLNSFHINLISHFLHGANSLHHSCPLLRNMFDVFLGSCFVDCDGNLFILSV